MNPLFTIITPALNAGSTLADALVSVRDQAGGIPFEHLLLDGGSTDDTLEVAAEFDFVATTSVKDRGLYDAMNKGAARASGEWLVFVQADDWLAPGALAAWAAGIEAHPKAQVMTGVPERFERRAGAWVARDNSGDPTDQKLSVRNIALGDPMLNARIIRKDAYLATGGFSLDYTYCSDREFLLQLCRQDVYAVEIPDKVYRYRWHEGSRTMNDINEFADVIAEENLAIAERWMNRVSKPDRRILREWHGRVSNEQAMRALEDRNLRGVGQSMRRAMRINPAWPTGFLAEFSRCLVGYVGRGCRTKTQVLRQAERV